MKGTGVEPRIILWQA